MVSINCSKYVSVVDDSAQTLTDLNKCKLTHSGREYRGTISTTVSGIRCQSWSGENQLHEVSENIKQLYNNMVIIYYNFMIYRLMKE